MKNYESPTIEQAGGQNGEEPEILVAAIYAVYMIAAVGLYVVETAIMWVHFAAWVYKTKNP